MNKKRPRASHWRICEVDESRSMSGHNNNLGCSALSACTGECLIEEVLSGHSLGRIIEIWPMLSASERDELLELAEAALTVKAGEDDHE